MKKPKIDQQKCIGCGSCGSICPEVFEIGEEGKAKVKKVEEDVLEEKEADIEEAAASCPVQAISR